MATGGAKTYEELRRQRVEHNLKQLEELGISHISRFLLEVTKFEQKQLIYIIKAIDNEDHKDKVRIRDTEEIAQEVESPEFPASQKRTTKSGSKRKSAKTKKSAYC